MARKPIQRFLEGAWTAPSLRALYDRYLPGWCHEPELLVRADCCIPSAALLDAHAPSRTLMPSRRRK